MNIAEKVIELPCHPSSVTRARHYVRDLLLEWELPRLVEDAQLGTSELVANAVRHAGTDLELTIRSGDAVTISIRDGSPQLRRPMAGDGDQLAESGRGLQIVAAISSDWGITTATGGKVVWFSLALPDVGTSDAEVLSIRGRRPEWVPAADHLAGHPDVDGVSMSSALHTAV